VNANQIRYVVGESITMLQRGRGSTAISTVIMGLSLLILVVFLLVTINVAGVIEKAGDEMRVYVYLRGGVAEALRREIQFRLIGMAGVEEALFVSRDEALASFRKTLGDDGDLLDALDSNPLPDAFRVKVKPENLRSEFLASLAAEVGKWEGVDEVRYGEQWLGRGERLVRGFFLVDLAVGLIIFLSVVFVIANTVRLTVLVRRQTIEIAKLVGATNAYIRIPFLIEGALQGVVAAGLAIGLLAIGYLFGRRYLPGLMFLSGEAIAIFVLFCALLGAVGSYGAMRRFLKM
jgi:cell division transport system permease protein